MMREGLLLIQWQGHKRDTVSYGFWMPITIALVIVQEMSARMGLVSKKGLADLIREKYGLRICFYSLILLVFADLGNTMAEFAGIAAAGELFGISRYLSVPLCTLIVWFIVLKRFLSISRKRFLFLAVLSI